MGRRILPALSLFFLAPLIAEYLLGSLPMKLIGILPLMAMLYGSGAILIRECVRRNGRGWLSIVLLAIAYGFIEEGLVTQSLFNPNYLHLRLLDFGFVPLLGTAIPWLVFVVSIHVFWSICVPIGLTETLFKNQRETPWLGWAGKTVFALLFLAGAAGTAGFTHKQNSFMATPAQFVAIGAVVFGLVLAAFIAPKKQTAATQGNVPHPVVLFLASFVLGSALYQVQHLAPNRWHWASPLCVAVLLGLEALFTAFLIVYTSGRVWSEMQRFALMAGGLWVYIWVGFGTDANLHGASDLPAHAVIAGLFAALCFWAGFIAMKPVKTVALADETMPS